MRLSLRFIILSGFLLVLLPALILLSYTDFTKAKSNLENNFDFMVEQTAENITGAYDLVEVSFRILSLSLEDTMKKAFEPFIQDYYSVDGQVDKIDLAKIKKGLGEEFDLYIINDKGVIIHTTFEKDLNLDFAKIAPSFNEKLQKIREESRYQGDRISNETVTGNVRKYGYWGTPDKKYILEIGIKSSQFEEPLKNLDLLKISADFEQFNPDLKSVNVFNGNGTVSNKPDFKVTEQQKNRIGEVYDTGSRIDFIQESVSEKWVYVKAEVEEEDGSASQGDKVIELIFDTSSLEQRLDDLATSQIIFTLLFIAIGGSMALFIANRISKPISSLTKSVETIASGDLGTDIVDSSSSKEVSNLSNGIIAMKDSIRGKINDIEVINASYERFVPKEFLTLLQKKSIIDVEIGDNSSLEMSVLFSDMRNFTMISERLSPQQSFKFLNDYLDKMTPAINDNQGFIDKYIGDAIMALFPSKPDDAVQAAIEMNKALKLLNKDKTSDQISMGIGIHMGNLVLGTIGKDTRMETTVISDTVNSSARLESLNKVYGTNILISGGIRHSLSDSFQSQSRLIDLTAVKGKSALLEVYEVLNPDITDHYSSKLETSKILQKVVKYFFDNKVDSAAKELKKISKYRETDNVVQYWVDKLK
jgi:class 3 adenylate cyclase/HAMP domain-containing protein